MSNKNHEPVMVERIYNISRMDMALKAKRHTMPKGISREDRRRLIIESAE